MRDGDAESQAVAQLPLNLLLPGAALRPIAAARIGQDEDVAGMRVALVSFGLHHLRRQETAKADVSWEVPRKIEPRLACVS